MGSLRIACRPSPLARLQAELVANLISERNGGISSEIVTVSTRGDELADLPLASIGGQGLFAKEVQRAVVDGRADIAVHSAKDLPPGPVDGLALCAVPAREDPRDVLVGSRLEALAPGACVATGSVRRRAQLASARPDLTFREVRGNIATRLERVPEGGALVMALAALRRLGLEDRVAEVLPTSVMLPQVGQGALAVECRVDDDAAAAMVRGIEDPLTRRCVDAERAFLARLGGSCDLPVGALAQGSTGGIALEATVASGDGRIVVRHVISGDDPVELGEAMAAHLVDRTGLAESLGMEVAVP